MEKNSLMDLFNKEDKQILNNNGKTLIFDTHNVAYRTLFSAIFSNPEDNEKFFLWKHMFINSIFSTIQHFKPNKVILAVDSKPSWRYTVYSKYKESRKEARDKTVVDFDKFFPIFNDFINQIRDTFSKIRVLEVENSEADDIIAILCKENLKNESIIIVSSDSDLNQLITSKIQQYDPINRKFIECINPSKELTIKILIGDKSDNIPPVKSRVGIVTAEKILNNGLDDFLKESEENKSNYIRNKTLIDFDFIPEKIREKIINKYNEYKLKDMESKKILNFFTQNKLVKLMESWNFFSDYIKSLE